MGIENPSRGDEYKKFEVAVMKGLSSIELPESHKQELEQWQRRISEASSEELETMIPEASDMSYREEALAREFVRRKIDSQKFLENAKFRTTKAILEGRM